MPGGVAASAQSAATLNARANSEDDKTTLAVVLTVSKTLESNVHDRYNGMKRLSWLQMLKSNYISPNYQKKNY